MRHLNKTLTVLLVLMLFLPLVARVKYPSLDMMVNDEAGILSRRQESELENLLKRVKDNTSAEVVLLTVTDLQGLTIEDYSIRLAEKWKVGKSDRDNGVILLVSTGDRKVRLEVGYGLESILTDARSSYIINDKIIPEFRRNDYYSGIKEGLTSVTGVITGEYEISDEELAAYQQRSQDKKGKGGFPFGIIIFILFMLLSGRRRGGLFTWLLLGSMFGDRGGRGGFGGFSGGSGGFGGFSGGGGSFGGGGASGGW